MIMNAACIFLAAPDAGAAEWLTRALATRGYTIECRVEGEPLLDGLRRSRPRAALIDAALGLSAIKLLRDELPNVALIAMGVHAAPAEIVACLRAGVHDFISLPCDTDDLERALASVPPISEAWDCAFGRVTPGVAESQRAPLSGAMRRLLDVVDRVAATDVTVLVTGESGSGKEHLADRVRARSGRARAAFVKVNCAALPAQLLESELFGYERGAFTGADRRKPGKFELAHRGTLFLDEISEMSPALQAKLLQVLQEGRFARLGGEEDVEVDVRIIAATHRDLRREVREGRFREDLYYRLNVVHLRVPALRERKDEILPLAEVCLARFCAEASRSCPTLPASLCEAFTTYSWPGNVRELENMLKRWMVFAQEEPILEHLRTHAARPSAETVAAGAGRGELGRFLAGETPRVSLRQVAKEASERAERRAIERVLGHTRWNRRRAAEILHVSYKALLYKMKDAGLSADG